MDRKVKDLAKNVLKNGMLNRQISTKTNYPNHTMTPFECLREQLKTGEITHYGYFMISQALSS